MKLLCKLSFTAALLAAIALSFGGRTRYGVSAAVVALLISWGVRHKSVTSQIVTYCLASSALLWNATVYFASIDFVFMLVFLNMSLAILFIAGLALFTRASDEEENIQDQPSLISSAWSDLSTAKPIIQQARTDRIRSTMQNLFWLCLAAAVLLSLGWSMFEAAFALNFLCLCLSFAWPASSRGRMQTTYATFALLSLLGGLAAEGSLGMLPWIFLAMFGFMAATSRMKG